MLRKSKTEKRLIVMSIIILFFGAMYHFGPKVLLLYVIKKNISKEDSPYFYLTPIDRDVRPTVLNASKLKKISLESLRLTVPWEVKEKITNELLSTIVFHEKKLISIKSQFKEERIIDTFLKGTPEKIKSLKELMGEENLRSDFEFVRMCLHTTPDQATIFTSKKLLGRIWTLRILRAIYEPLGGPVFEFNMMNGLKGFQFGGVGEDKTVTIHLFDDERQVFEIEFVSATQSEIDYVLSTIEIL